MYGQGYGLSQSQWNNWTIAEQDDDQLVLDAWRHRQVQNPRTPAQTPGQLAGPNGLGSLNVTLSALASDMVKDRAGPNSFSNQAHSQGTSYGKPHRGPSSASQESTAVGFSDAHLSSASGLSGSPMAMSIKSGAQSQRPILELSERRRSCIKAAFRRIDVKDLGCVTMQELIIGLQQFSHLSHADQQRLCNAICGTNAQQVSFGLQQVTFGQFCLYYKTLGSHIELDSDFEDLVRFHWGFAEVSDLIDDMKNKLASIGLAYTFRHSLDHGSAPELSFEAFQGAVKSVGIGYSPHDVRRLYDAFKMADLGHLQGLDILKVNAHFTSAARPRTPVPASYGATSLSNTPNHSTTSLHTLSAGYQSGTLNNLTQQPSWTNNLSSIGSLASSNEGFPEPAPAPPETPEVSEEHENPYAPPPLAPTEDDDDGCLAPDEKTAHSKYGYPAPPEAPAEADDDLDAPNETFDMDEEDVDAPSESGQGRLPTRPNTSTHTYYQPGLSRERFPEPVPAPPETPEASEQENPNAPPPVAPAEDEDDGCFAPEDKAPHVRLGFARPPEAPPEDDDEMPPNEFANPQDDDAIEAPAESAHGLQLPTQTGYTSSNTFTLSHGPGTEFSYTLGAQGPTSSQKPIAPGQFVGGHLAAAQMAGNTDFAGEKRAVTIGINYSGLPAGQGALTGCINDSDTFIKLLTQEFGYKLTDIRQLRDDQPQRMPTKKNILAALTWLVTGAKSGDHLFFHYSGHGTQQRDVNREEMDGFDECLVPSDFQQKGMLSDDDLRRALVMPLPKGVRLTVILDSCHSGTAMDLPYKAVLRADGHTVDMKKKPSDRMPPRAEADVVMLAGCQDAQTSADIGAGLAGNSKAAGAMTTAFKEVITEHVMISYHDLMIKVRSFLKSRGFSQVPQLCSENFLNLSECFMPEVEPQYEHPPPPLRPPERRALTIGINYSSLLPGRGRLAGCINDSNIMVGMFKEVFGFQDSQIRQLRDDHHSFMPTRSNILSSISWLTQGAGNGDEMFLHYSGHGGQREDRSGDERDGKDETLVPCDFQSCGQITDDELHSVLMANLPKGCRLWAIFDCAHSGTALDLQYKVVISPDGKSTHISKGTSSRPQAPTQAEVIMLSGCKDSQSSATINTAMPCGAMTTAFRHCVNQQVTCHDLLCNMRNFLKLNNFQQVPQMCSEQFIQLDTSFVHYQMKRRRKRELPPSLAYGHRSGSSMPTSPVLAPAMPLSSSMPQSPGMAQMMSQSPGMAQMSANDYVMNHRINVLEEELRRLRQQQLTQSQSPQHPFPPSFPAWGNMQ